ncbi:unnamed protein product, partial [Hapterophycus canaliculatus]
RLKDVQARRRRADGAALAALEASEASSLGAGGVEPTRRQERTAMGSNHGELTCEACGKSPLREDTRSMRSDVLYRARRPDHAVTCRVCEGFFVCGDCFNRQWYQHNPDHQASLVLYAREERLAEQSPWPSRHRGMPPPPDQAGTRGRPRRGPWG